MTPVTRNASRVSRSSCTRFCVFLKDTTPPFDSERSTSIPRTSKDSRSGDALLPSSAKVQPSTFCTMARSDDNIVVIHGIFRATAPSHHIQWLARRNENTLRHAPKRQRSQAIAQRRLGIDVPDNDVRTPFTARRQSQLAIRTFQVIRPKRLEAMLPDGTSDGEKGPSSQPLSTSSCV